MERIKSKKTRGGRRAAIRVAGPVWCATAMLWAASARAYDVSAPVILQDFESSYTNIINKTPDIFESGYGGVYLPPPGITLNGTSVGYDVYDRFNLGTSANPTLYGTQAGFKSVVQGIHGFGGSAYADLLWTWTNGINHSNNSSFSEFPGLTTVLQTTNPSGAGYNTQGYNSAVGDFYPTSDSNQDEEALAGLQHNDPTSNFNLIREPTIAGNPQNIPEGTGTYLGSVANVPTPSNAQFYPDKSQTPRVENDPTLSMTNFSVYPFNTSNPTNGTPVADNALGYFMRYTQWMVQAMGVDGFRYDGGNNTYPWVMNYLDLATYDMSNRTLLNGQKENVFTFSEVYTGTSSTIQQYISKTALSNQCGRHRRRRSRCTGFPALFCDGLQPERQRSIRIRPEQLEQRRQRQPRLERRRSYEREPGREIRQRPRRSRPDPQQCRLRIHLDAPRQRNGLLQRPKLQ